MEKGEQKSFLALPTEVKSWISIQKLGHCFPFRFHVFSHETGQLCVSMTKLDFNFKASAFLVSVEILILTLL